jgi:hypothetical protein
MKVYYAHCMAIYNTPQEARDVQELTKLGFEILNPNHEKYENAYKDKGMKVFEEAVFSCDALAFRSLPDGRIPAGIYKEIEYAKDASIPVFELPSGTKSREMTVDVTREYLRESGFR